jgi:hypothetical protein
MPEVQRVSGMPALAGTEERTFLDEVGQVARGRGRRRSGDRAVIAGAQAAFEVIDRAGLYRSA